MGNMMKYDSKNDFIKVNISATFIKLAFFVAHACAISVKFFFFNQ